MATHDLEPLKSLNDTTKIFLLQFRELFPVNYSLWSFSKITYFRLVERRLHVMFLFLYQKQILERAPIWRDGGHYINNKGYTLACGSLDIWSNFLQDGAKGTTKFSFRTKYATVYRFKYFIPRVDLIVFAGQFCYK